MRPSVSCSKWKSCYIKRLCRFNTKSQRRLSVHIPLSFCYNLNESHIVAMHAVNKCSVLFFHTRDICSVNDSFHNRCALNPQLIQEISFAVGVYLTSSLRTVYCRLCNRDLVWRVSSAFLSGLSRAVQCLRRSTLHDRMNRHDNNTSVCVLTLWVQAAYRLWSPSSVHCPLRQILEWNIKLATTSSSTTTIILAWFVILACYAH
jgi:hypothetical protein